MKIETVDLHNLGLSEAMAKAEKNLLWCIEHEVAVIDFIHGKGLHSERRFSVIKQELRRYLKNSDLLKDSGYRIVPGESDLPIALSFDEGHTLVVKRGLEKEYLGGQRQQQKNQLLFSQQGRQVRKNAKAINSAKRKRKPR
ncbi:MAG TPA: Smr/MutS family protein [Syntrophomonadaceae bacterium]|nr:Smr/MutS family protein [Syntrophomonadaceae bacterium]HQA06855.1 Smr/MutS family protein [Syntrophomonadaceae bacterium]HQE22843.1 Smr/MutS family protein [Syntrophomonadaceae bacterium]